MRKCNNSISEEIKFSLTGSFFIKSVETYFLLSSGKTVIAAPLKLFIYKALTAPKKLAPEEIPTPRPRTLESF